MTTISIDVAAIFREIRLTVWEIKNERAAANEKRKAAQLLVYRALSLHPALDHMKPPTGMLADVDWYTELRSTFSSGIFRRLGQNDHFKRMALLGDTGTRARIMLLLLWIIGHRLSESVAKLLSTAFGDAIKRDENQDLEDEINQLVLVKEVLVSLRKMIKMKLPLAPDRNPFLGDDYTPEDEDKPLPRSELWGYTLPEHERYEYDVRNNPALLIRPLLGKTIIPQTKLTILIIQWAACNFGLGKKVYSAEDIDPDAFWNADPPPADHDDEDEDRLSLSSFSSRDSLAFEPHEGVATAPYDAGWQDDATEDWVHSRFCSVYPLHGWAHRSLVRVLLFNSFCGTQTLPGPSEILVAVHVADRLVQRLPPDIWDYAQQFIIVHALMLYEAENATDPWDPRNTVIFVDARRWIEAAMDVRSPPGLARISIFFTNPRVLCPDAPDILALPAASSWDTHSSLNVLPKLDPATCICGQCALIESQQPSTLDSFRSQYSLVTSSRSHCDALARTWEPSISAAETWLEALMSRVESQFALFPDFDGRMGPAVLEVANAMDVVVGSRLSDQDLLRFFVALSILLVDDYPGVVIPKPPGPFGLGYVVALPWTADREDYKVDEGPDRVLFVNDGWLYDSIGTEGITLLHQGDEFKVMYRTNILSQFSAVCMPQFKGDFISLSPDLLPSTTAITAAPLEAIDEENHNMELTVVLSRLPTDGFPLLSVCSETGFAAPRGALAALIRVKCLDRVLETVWRPDIKRGSPCEHTALWRRATRQSLTAIDLIRRVIPASDASLKATDVPTLSYLAFASSDDVAAQCQQRLREMMEALSRRVEPLTVTGSPLERTRAVIVRCGVKDGPIDAVAVLAASVRKNVYIFDRSECWECALIRMSEGSRSVGISIDTKY
ncbi:hypothetical protein C8F04DRAFT_1085268 [Mycena alexandri]|uniref:Uncharacterized protein n=1 Tax=Mycena alexandri TaxID=1745969 RepID=A0AAD6T5U4_9AGAR|nr:hypothetical protein C8F04DRAFT_1085268 [Mycena alexandri]